MKKSLIQTGNSKALIMSKDMREHLGITDSVEVQFRKSTIVLRHPDAPDEEEGPTKAPKATKEAKPPKEKGKKKGK